ncbi:MAG: DUF3800 domain-containing protein [Pseudomonadota bacterium]
MLVFIDESGDAGFKIGSSPCLIMALVIFDDYEEADITRTKIIELMKKTGVKPEYKFSSCSGKNKTLFFEEISQCKFKVSAIVMQKSLLKSDFLRKIPDNFYNYTLKNLIDHNGLNNARIRIDGKGNKIFVNAVKSYLRSQTQKGTIHSLNFLDSKREPLIQLSDMVVGAIARPYNRKEDENARKWQEIIKNRIINIWAFKTLFKRPKLIVFARKT